MTHDAPLFPVSRRQMLAQSGAGFGMLGLAGVLDQQSVHAAAKAPVAPAVSIASSNPLAAKSPHHTPKAKRVIFLFMNGGPSHVDTFDPKPELVKQAGKKGPGGKWMPTPFKFANQGQSGIPVSDLYPHVSTCIDDICVIRSMYTSTPNHEPGLFMMNSGVQQPIRPAMGSWLNYGLGTENQNLPGFVVVAPNQPAQGAPLWDSSFLPAAYQGTCVTDLKQPITNLANGSLDANSQRRQLDLLARLNRFHRNQSVSVDELDARIASFELAFRMQSAAPEAFDLSGESKITQELYGIDDTVTQTFGEQCLLARRLVERGVRVVQLYHNRSSTASGCQIWDQHSNLKMGLTNNCAASDQPIAGLLTDLKARGLLDDTLVVWGGEFGRTPTAEGKNGREHHPFGFTMWLAGGGIKGGTIHGSTDEFGWYSQDDKVHVHDLHATILHLMGLDHERLTWRHAGRDFRLTDVHGRVVHEILSHS